MKARSLVIAGALLAAIALAPGCVERIAEGRVRDALLGAGLSERHADCMAHRMVKRLSIAQLRKLEALKGEHRSLSEYVMAVREVDDTEAVAVTVSSAALCATGFAR